MRFTKATGFMVIRDWIHQSNLLNCDVVYKK